MAVFKGDRSIYFYSKIIIAPVKHKRTFSTVGPGKWGRGGPSELRRVGDVAVGGHPVGHQHFVLPADAHQAFVERPQVKAVGWQVVVAPPQGG